MPITVVCPSRTTAQPRATGRWRKTEAGEIRAVARTRETVVEARSRTLRLPIRGRRYTPPPRGPGQLTSNLPAPLRRRARRRGGHHERHRACRERDQAKRI